MQKILDEKYAALSPGERVKIGFSMFDFAKQLAKSSIRQSNPNISEKDLQKQVFLRFYKDDFEEKSLKKILKALF